MIAECIQLLDDILSRKECTQVIPLSCLVGCTLIQARIEAEGGGRRGRGGETERRERRGGGAEREEEEEK